MRNQLGFSIDTGWLPAFFRRDVGRICYRDHAGLLAALADNPAAPCFDYEGRAVTHDVLGDFYITTWHGGALGIFFFPFFFRIGFCQGAVLQVHTRPFSI